MHTRVKARQLLCDGLLAHPATTDYNDHWKVKRPQAGVGGTRQGPSLLPRIIVIFIFPNNYMKVIHKLKGLMWTISTEEL